MLSEIRMTVANAIRIVGHRGAAGLVASGGR